MYGIFGIYTVSNPINPPKIMQEAIVFINHNTIISGKKMPCKCMAITLLMKRIVYPCSYLSYKFLKNPIET